MPQASKEATLARQWELLRNHVPSSPPGRTARQLRQSLESAGYKVTKRTVERDMDELSRIFPIVRNERGVPFGWHWIQGARFDVLGMDLSEAVSLGLMEDVLRQIMPPAFLAALEGKFSMARQKLAALPKVPHARWKDLVRYLPPGLPFAPPAIPGHVLAVVQEALLHQRQIKVQYQKPGAAEAKEQVLHPLSLIQQGARSYLAATAFDYENVIFYALHRIAQAEILEEPARRPKGFKLDAYLAGGAAQFGCGASIVLKAKLSEELAGLLEETPFVKDQKITRRAGQVRLTATVPDSWSLHFWILSQGPRITVMKPASLRKQVRGMLEESLGNYRA